MSTPEPENSNAAATAPSTLPATNPLREWMNEKANLHAREAILMHRLCFDIQLAAARRGYYLNTYYDDVDHDGFDLIFDDQDTLKKMQVKTVAVNAGTGQWDIHKRILRPCLEHISKLGFECSSEGEGVEGGFILMQFDTEQPDVGVKYFYTDLYVWLAFDCGVIERQHGGSRKAVDDCIKDLQCGLGDQRVGVPWALMLEAKGPDELLALGGLHSRAEFTWKDHIFIIANHERPCASRERQLPRLLPDLKRVAADEIRALVVDSDLLNGVP
jgi:hypothetical protein